MQVLSVWQLALPLPAILLITVGLYMLLLGAALWLRYCFKDRCSVSCSDCCPGVSLCENCFKMAEVCDCRPPSVRSCLGYSCPTPSELQEQCQCRCPTSGGAKFEAGSLCQRFHEAPCPPCCCVRPSGAPLCDCVRPSGAPLCECPSFNCVRPSGAPLCECPCDCCSNLDCACTCQPPECDTCNCLCFEIRIK